jgi:citrate synthase
MSINLDYQIDIMAAFQAPKSMIPAAKPASTTVSDYVTASEAIALLGIKPQTLYTYVSRGLIRSVTQPNRKQKLYYREDIDKVRAQAEARQGHGVSAATALRWGHPVITTAVTELTPEGPRYRNRLAIDLARQGCSFEAASELLWTGVLHHDPLIWDCEPLPAGFGKAMDGAALQPNPLPLLRIYALATSMLGAAESGGSEIRRGTTIPAARQLIQTLTGCLGYLGKQPRFHMPPASAPVAATALLLLNPKTPKAKDRAGTIAAVNAALVLCADHELSSSTFAARVAASTGAELRACILAAIGTHSGAALGGGCDRIEDLLREARTRPQIRQRLTDFEQAGTRVPGFNLPVYPKGDPRARYLLHLAQEFADQSEQAQLVYQLIDEAESALQLRPSIEVGLVALCAALNLPRRSAGALWALGRTAGWIAHVLEQRLAGYPLRPRARYVTSG